MKQFLTELGLWIFLVLLFFAVIVAMNSKAEASVDCVKPYRKCMDRLLAMPYKVNFKPCNKAFEQCKKRNQ